LDNGLGLPPEDFIVKPVRHSELLDWLERRLALQWLDEVPPVTEPVAVVASAKEIAPPAADCEALLDLARLGYYRGIVNMLDGWLVAHPASLAFTERMQALARQYQFETMAVQLQKALDASPVQ
jgi:hypothetical protein